VTLDFLTPRGPGIESPVTAASAAAGGLIEERDGWRVAVRFETAEAEAAVLRESVGWADLSHLRKTELTGQANAVLGDATPTGEGWTCPVTPDRTLVIGTAADGLDVTTQYGAILVAGPLAREVIARFCALDLRPQAAPPGSFLPGSVARTPGYVLVEDTDRFLLLFGSAYGIYLWETVADAGAHLGGRPVGADAVRKEASADA
jgi:glycine cleavage system aminomethyltransferase T